jgi:hypothetical protein
VGGIIYLFIYSAVINQEAMQHWLPNFCCPFIEINYTIRHITHTYYGPTS